mgnify:CR=1 FL=1
MILHHNSWFDVALENDYYSIRPAKKDVIVLPVVEKNKVVIVGVKRPILGKISNELPAGYVEDSEGPLEAAARELCEETGIIINDLSRFIEKPPIYVLPSRIPCATFIYTVFITYDEFINRKQHDAEIEHVTLLSYEQYLNMLKRGEVNVAIVIGLISNFFLEKFILK